MSFPFEQELTERFLRYVAITSQSDASAGVVPSTPGQWDMAKTLQSELSNLGLVDIELSEYCVLTAKLPSNTNKQLPAIGFCAHLDTVDVNLNPNITAQLVHYTGGDICLNEADQIYIRLAEHPELEAYINDDIFVSDGHSVLGADDKASVASIMTALHYLQQHPDVQHGDIHVAFVPDEEIGLVGAKHMNFDKFPVDFAYTLDCCGITSIRMLSSYQ